MKLLISVVKYSRKGSHVLLVGLETVTAFWGRQSDNPIKIKNTFKKKKNLPAMWETWVWSLGWEDSLEKEMATHSSILAWEILQRSLVSDSPESGTELDTTEVT